MSAAFLVDILGGQGVASRMQERSAFGKLRVKGLKEAELPLPGNSIAP